MEIEISSIIDSLIIDSLIFSLRLVSVESFESLETNRVQIVDYLISFGLIQWKT